MSLPWTVRENAGLVAVYLSVSLFVIFFPSLCVWVGGGDGMQYGWVVWTIGKFIFAKIFCCIYLKRGASVVTYDFVVCARQQNELSEIWIV